MKAIIDLGKVGLTPGGDWATGKNYEKLTLVLNRLSGGGDGCGYISLKDNNSVRPGTDPETWMKVVEVGQSIYDLCVARGYQGTEDQFVAEYNAAVADALAAAASAAAQEAQVAAAEQQRVSAEQARVLAAQAQAQAAQAAQSAEEARQAAERARAAAETLRADTFATQSAAMTTALGLAETATTAANEAAASANTAAQEANAAAQAAADYANRVAALEEAKARIFRDLGYRAEYSTIQLAVGEAGKYVKCESRTAVANSAFNISAPFDVEACSELLIKTGYNPSDSSHAALDISVIAIYEEIERTRVVQKTNAGGQPLYYVVEVDPETGTETVTTEETTTNTGHPVYTSETYTEHRYLPNNEDRWVQIPDSGYYVANIPQSCKCVISYKPGVTDMEVVVVKHGALANLTSQIFGIYEHRTMGEAVVSLAARIAALEARHDRLGNATAGNFDALEYTKNNAPVVLLGHGVPAGATAPENWPAGLHWDGIPWFAGQVYINLDAGSAGVYYAINNTAVSGWKNA